MPERHAGGPAIVVLRALALGDLLTAVPALRAIRAAFPEHRRYLTSPPWLRPLVEHLDLANACLDSAPGTGGGVWRTSHPADRIPLERAQLHGLVGAPERPDVAVNLRGVREATHIALLRLRPRRFIGYANPAIPVSTSGPVWDPEEHEVSRWCRLLVASGIPADPADLHVAAPRTPAARRLRGCCVIHPGAGSPARQWPAERWTAVVRWLRARGERVVLTGGAGELDIAARIAADAGVAADDVLAGRLSTLELLGVVGAARLLASTDTGVAHMAFATRTPSVTLFGPTLPSLWGPPPDARHRVLWAGSRGEPYAPKPDSTMLALGVRAVLDALEDLRGYREDDVDAEQATARATRQQ